MLENCDIEKKIVRTVTAAGVMKQIFSNLSEGGEQ